jgi:hypothetical protein
MLRNSTPRSLLLIDEFGKGTQVSDARRARERERESQRERVKERGHKERERENNFCRFCVPEP